MRTPLALLCGLVTSRKGTGHFVLQRITAIANIPFIIFLIYVIMSIIGEQHASVSEVLSAPFNVVFILVSLLSITVHMYLGMQTVIEDYIRSELIQLLMSRTNSIFCILIAIIGCFAIFKLS